MTDLTSAGILNEYSEEVSMAVDSLQCERSRMSMVSAMLGRGPLGMLMRQDMAVQLHKDKRNMRLSTSGDKFTSKVPAEYNAFKQEFVFFKDEPMASLGKALEINEAIACNRAYKDILNTRYAELLFGKMTNDSVRVGEGVEVVSDSNGLEFHFNDKSSCLVSACHSSSYWYNSSIRSKPRYQHESEELTVDCGGFLTYEDACLYIGAVSEYCHLAYTKYIEKRYGSLQSFTERSRVVPEKLLASVEAYINLKQQKENIKLAKQGMADKNTPLSYAAIGTTISLQIDYSKSVRDVENHEWLKVEALSQENVSLTHFSLNNIPKFIPCLKIKLVKLHEGTFKVTEIKQPIAEEIHTHVHNEEINILESGLYLSDTINRFESLALKAKAGELNAYELGATNLLNPMAAAAVMLHLEMFEALPEAVSKQSELVKQELINTKV